MMMIIWRRFDFEEQQRPLGRIPRLETSVDGQFTHQYKEGAASNN